MFSMGHQLVLTSLVLFTIGFQLTTAASIGLYRGVLGQPKQSKCLDFQNHTQQSVYVTLESNSTNDTLFFVETTGRLKGNRYRKLGNTTRSKLLHAPRFFVGFANKRINAEMSVISIKGKGGYLISLNCQQKFDKSRVSTIFEATVNAYRSPNYCMYPITKERELLLESSQTTDGTSLVSIKRKRRESAAANDTAKLMDFDFDVEEHPESNADSPKPKVAGDCRMAHSRSQRKRRATKSDDDTEQIGRTRREMKIAPETRGPYYIELHIIIDNKLVNMFEKNVDMIVRRMELVIHYANTIYRKYNIEIALKGVEVWSGRDELEYTRDSGELLSRFGLFVKSKGKKYTTDVDHVHMITGYEFDEGVVGKAYYNSMCAPATSIGYTSDSPHWNVQRTATIFVHEMGHSMGMLHDEHGCSCKHTRGCIMSPNLVTPAPKYFSACSEEGLYKYLDSWRSHCLLNRARVNPYQTATLCGNNRVDDGEECDCGEPGYCMNPCCDPYTCKLTKGSQCFEGGCCKNCQLKHKGATCRLSSDDCDLPDSCDGASPHCPNRFKEDGSACVYSGKCLKGKCKSRTIQCERLFGKGTENGPYNCYLRINKVGRDFGYCRLTESGATVNYVGCHSRDAECGKLQCKSPTTNTMPSNGWRTGYSEVNLKYGGGKCKSAYRGYGGRQEEDPTMVANGTPCGSQMECRYGRCRSGKRFVSKCRNCPESRGSCTNTGTCQCNPEWAGLNCMLTVEEAKRKAEEEFKAKKKADALEKEKASVGARKEEMDVQAKAKAAAEAAAKSKKEADAIDRAVAQAKAQEEAEARRRQEALERVGLGKKIKRVDVITVVSGEGMIGATLQLVLLIPLFFIAIQFFFL